MTYELIRPFGPIILKSKLPNEIIEKINEYVETEQKQDKKFPNLLSRDISNIYLENQFSKEIGFTNFVESLGNEYLKNASSNTGNNQVFLNPIDPKHDDEFKNLKEIYADAWVNRYFSGDYTPIHRHNSFISGVALLKVSVDLIKEQNYNNDGSIREQELLNGKLEFIMSSSDVLCNNVWFPPQEVGTVLIFPSWLIHHTYPFKNSKERRTISFNLNLRES
jgi:hypothetical protein